MRPDSNWAVNMLEPVINIPQENIFFKNVNAVATGPNQVLISLTDLYLYVPTCASSEYISDLTYYLSLEEFAIQTKALPSSGQYKDTFTIPWSTQTVCNAIQTSAVGSQTVCPPSKFFNIYNTNAANNLISLDVKSNNLESLQVTYSKIYPENSYEIVIQQRCSKQLSKIL